MTAIDLTLSLPDSIAQEAKASGLLAPRKLAQLVRAEMRRQAAERLRVGAERATRAGSKPMSLVAIQREVDDVRAARKRSSAA
jgi:hypothetical protein